MTMRFMRPIIVAGALAALFTTAAAVPATASSGPRLQAGRFAPSNAVAPPSETDPDATSGISHVWSGWVDLADTNVALRYVRAQFKVPKVSCINGRQVYLWVGLDGTGSSGTVEQDGVAVVCTEGSNGPEPHYYTFYEMYPYGPESTSGVSPGDTITASVYYNSANIDYELAVSDNKHPGANININRTCPSGHSCKNNSAEVIAEDPGGGVAKGNYLADFGTVNFYNVAVTSRDGTKGTLEGNSLWAAVKVTMKTPDDTIVMAQPSDRTDGYTAFSDTYKSTG